ncbi:hypothetical protein PIB30_039071 [Stylosanthes scabra]|uniref:Threonylcarbamoyl-AMP synthase n=1 Tax=Stylosanthes scabra TaxID=79078 RepID=A0ABU6VCS7_9FABA|nr:hypothetical protein [Stylosanthes scabra]
MVCVYCSCRFDATFPPSSFLGSSVSSFPSTRVVSNHKFPIVSMAIKRSPKRLKYTTPRFTKEDGLVYIEADPSGSDTWKLEPVVNLLKEGAVGVIPTDTLYAIACDLRCQSAIERLRSVLLQNQEYPSF